MLAVARRKWPAEPTVPRRPLPPFALRWSAVVTAAVGLLTVPPVVLAAFRVPSGRVFPGYLVIARDAYVYQSMWLAGWHGAWLFHPAYTAEMLPGILLYPWYLWPAHLVGWASGPWLYHAARLLAAAALLTAVSLLIRELFRPHLLRRWAFVVCVLGGGIGRVLPRDIPPVPLATHATEMSSPGSSVADLVSMAPHLPWALALLCWTMVVALRLRHRRDQRLVAGGVLAVVGLQLIYPQLALLALVTIAGWALLRHQPRAVAFVVPAALVQLPYLGYLLWVWATTPDALRVVRTSLDVGDPFGFLVLSHLVASGLIIVALASRRLRGDLVLPALWIVGMTAFMFVPGLSGTLGRSFMASSVPFGLCAAPGLLVVLRRVRDVDWRRRVLALVLAGSSPYGLVSLAQPYAIAAFRLGPCAEYGGRAEAGPAGRLAPAGAARRGR